MHPYIEIGCTEGKGGKGAAPELMESSKLVDGSAAD